MSWNISFPNGVLCVRVQSILEATMDQLLKRRAEAEHAIKDLESFYAETVVKSISCTPSLITDTTQICTTKFSCLFVS